KHTTLSGEIQYNGHNLLGISEKKFRKIRGSEIAMIFQEPMSALNPSLKCGFQVAEILRLHLGMSAAEARNETLSLFGKVKLPKPINIYNSFPHQISGGQMQRVMIAMAIACKPKLLIADEPTTALDVTVQKEIILLLKAIQEETKMAMLFISHDLNLVSEIADSVVVMYRGEIVEQASTIEIFKNPKAEYTKALLASRPSLSIRLAELPTIASIADKTFIPREIKAAERAKKHKKIYTTTPLLEVSNLVIYYLNVVGILAKNNIVKVVDYISFSVLEGEALGLVGESGCGTSTLGKTILQLVKAAPGSIKYKGMELTMLSNQAIRN